MLCEKVLGNIYTDNLPIENIDYVDIEWHETYKKLHKKTSRNGVEVAVRLDNEILLKGLKDGDVLWYEGNSAVVVNIPEFQVIIIDCDHHQIPKVCYEIGNRHASLFYGEGHHQFITPYTQPMAEMLEKIGAKIQVTTMKVDLNKSISSTVNSHTH